MSLAPPTVTLHSISYDDFQATCPYCSEQWQETAHSLWDVVALTCPKCEHLLAVKDEDFHGDANAAPQDE